MSIAPRLVVLISGRGSNLRAILDSPAGDAVAAVISDNTDAAGLDIARQYGKKAVICHREIEPSAADFEKALAAAIAAEQATLIALAGFMRILSPVFIAAHTGRLVNIHPSLLPKFPGLNTHRRALAAGEKTHGCTVHWVNEKVDGGEIIAQRELHIEPHEDEESLKKRVLAEEHNLYPQVLTQLLKKLENPGEKEIC